MFKEVENMSIKKEEKDMKRIDEEYCEAENFAQSEIQRNARAVKRERKLMDR